MIGQEDLPSYTGKEKEDDESPAGRVRHVFAELPLNIINYLSDIWEKRAYEKQGRCPECGKVFEINPEKLRHMKVCRDQRCDTKTCAKDMCPKCDASYQVYKFRRAYLEMHQFRTT